MTGLTWAGEGADGPREQVPNLQKWAVSEKPEEGPRERCWLGSSGGRRKGQRGRRRQVRVKARSSKSHSLAAKVLLWQWERRKPTGCMDGAGGVGEGGEGGGQ